MLNQLFIFAHRVSLKGYIIDKIRVLSLLLILAGILLSSCTGAVQMFPTATPTPNLTVTPTLPPTPTLSPTPTSTATIEPTPEPTQRTGPLTTAVIPLRLDRPQKIEEGGFSFRPPIGYAVVYRPNQATLTSADQDTVFTLLGGRVEREEELEADFQEFIDVIANQLEEFRTDEFDAFPVDGKPGLAARVTGKYGETQITGLILIVAPSEDQLFYALVIAPDTDSGQGWEPEGRQAFNAIINSITFFEPVAPQE